MSEPIIWEIAMPGKPTQQFIPLALHKQKLNALQAEVEELKRMLEASTFGIEFAKEDIKKLKAEVERLTKAGDELVYWVGCDEYPERVITEWNAAKEGKPSV